MMEIHQNGKRTKIGYENCKQYMSETYRLVNIDYAQNIIWYIKINHTISRPKLF